jgi:hypothetical protein
MVPAALPASTTALEAMTAEGDTGLGCIRAVRPSVRT